MKKMLASSLFISVIQLSISVNAESLHLRKISEGADKTEMCLVPEGKFDYGINWKDIWNIIKVRLKEGWADIYDNEGNDKHQKETINLPDFYIDCYEVTNEKYNQFLAVTKYKRQPQYKDDPKLNAPLQPIVGIGWADAEAYCKWGGKQLPTEEQWEKAARGTDGRIWPWGGYTTDKTIDKELFNGKFNGKTQKNFAPVAVGTFKDGTSPYGVADMAGNFWEMTSSSWDKTDKSKVMRGGSFLNSLGMVRVTVRWTAEDEKDGADWLGFRCVENNPGQSFQSNSSR